MTGIYRRSRLLLRTMFARFKESRAMRRQFRLDRIRFSLHGCASRRFSNAESQLAYIRMLEHSIEKGLSLPEPKPGFGQKKVAQLCDSIVLHYQQYGWTRELYSAVGSLDAYQEFNRRSGTNNDEIESRIACVQRIRPLTDPMATPAAAAIRVSRTAITSAAGVDLAGFFGSRHSIRQFAADPVDLDSIALAVRMAQKTPSVCNRQSSRVYVFDNDEVGKSVLTCQAGNSGFGHTANKILIVTSDLRCFLSLGERNQCWIDGGMFAMSLIYALHSLGLGTCCLNWSVEHESDKRLRSVADIPKHENIILLIAVGHIPEELLVAASSRLDLDQVMRVRCQSRSKQTSVVALDSSDVAVRRVGIAAVEA